MDGAPAYHIIFSGKLREGFEQSQVSQALGEKLKLSKKQLQLLFSGKPQVLKRTGSADEAKQLVSQLAELGAIARIHTDRVAKQAGEKEQAAAVQAQASAASAQLPRFSPFPKGGGLIAALIMAAASEVFFALLYIFMLFAFSVVLVYYNLFTTWGSALVGFAPLALLLQLVLLLLGGIVLFLLAKPLSAFNPLHRRGVEVSAEQEPDLYAFVEDVCERINAPLPQQIRITNNTEVELVYLGGPIGFLLNRHRLTIGAPLAAACDTSQLAALIAQTLQLFHSKSLSPRAAFLLRNIDGWLQRAIYGKDAIDRWLEDQAGSLALLAKPLQRLIALSRQLIGLRLRLSRSLNRRLMHRLVADADKVSLVFTGSDGFTRLLEQQRLLAFASQTLLPKLRQRWQQQGDLPDNLVQAMVLRCKQYPATIHQQLRDKQEREKALSHDTIPADSQRLRRVSKNTVKGAYSCHSPASSLFRNFSKLARTMTVRLYHNRLRIPVSPTRLVPASTPGKQQLQQQQQIEALLGPLYLDFLPLKLRHAVTLMGDYDSAIERRSKALAEMAQQRSHAELAYRRCVENDQALIDVSIQEVIYRAGLWRQWEVEREDKEGIAHLHRICREQEASLEENLELLTHQLQPSVQRLAATLALLATPQAAKLKGAAALRQEVDGLLEVLERIEHSAPQLRSLRLHTALLCTLFSYDGGEKGKQHESIEEQASEVQKLLTGLGANLRTTPYPFAASHDNLMAFALHNAYPDETPEGDYDRGNDVVTHMARLQRHILARLCAIALHVEKGLGL